jgi:hypothetical protein
MIVFLSRDSCLVFLIMYPFADHDFRVDFQVSFILQLWTADHLIAHSQVYDVARHTWRHRIHNSRVDYLLVTSNIWVSSIHDESKIIFTKFFIRYNIS